MPNRYYVLDYDYFAILVIDSNTLIYDEPQQHWIRSTIERLKPSKQWIGVAAHHPLIYMGKRAEHKCEWDTYVKSTIGAKDPWFTTADHYQPLMVTPTGLHKIDSPQKGHKHKYNNIGKFLLAFINHNELPIDVWLCAHEHFLGVMKLTTAKGNTITQITSGGAGAEVKLDSIRYVDPAGNYNTKNEYTISPHLDEAKLQCELAAEQYGFFTLTLSKLKITCTPTLVENPKPDKFVFIREGNTINGELCFTCATAV